MEFGLKCILLDFYDICIGHSKIFKITQFRSVWQYKIHVEILKFCLENSLNLLLLHQRIGMKNPWNTCI